MDCHYYLGLSLLNYKSVQPTLPRLLVGPRRIDCTDARARYSILKLQGRAEGPAVQVNERASTAATNGDDAGTSEVLASSPARFKAEKSGNSPCQPRAPEGVRESPEGCQPAREPTMDTDSPKGVESGTDQRVSTS